MIIIALILCANILIIVAVVGFATQNPEYKQLEKVTIIGNQINTADAAIDFGNFHAIMDRSIFALGSWLNSDKAYFRHGTDTLSFDEHLNNVKLKMPNDFEMGLHEVDAQTLEGKMEPAFRVAHWHSDHSPALIYNHGAGQYPFDAIFNSIFDTKTIEQPLKLNLIIVRTPYHQKSRSELNSQASTLSRFLSIMAVSVRINEMLIQKLKKRGTPKIVLTGISLGGYIANLHHLKYNSAHTYIPIVAGTAFDDIFLHTSKADEAALSKPEIIQFHLNFSKEWIHSDNNNVHPILARYDQINRLEIQGPAYGNMPVEIWNLGHITTATSVKAIRHFLLNHLIEK